MSDLLFHITRNTNVAVSRMINSKVWQYHKHTSNCCMFLSICQCISLKIQGGWFSSKHVVRSQGQSTKIRQKIRKRTKEIKEHATQKKSHVAILIIKYIGTDSETKFLGFQFYPYYMLAVSPWANYLTSLLSLPVYSNHLILVRVNHGR